MAAALAGCATPRTATPSATSTTAPSAASSAAQTCDAFQALRQVDALLAGRDFEAHYLTINEQLTLSIWMVDPEIDPAATSATLSATDQMAFDFGLALSWQAISQVPCVGGSFVNINPMIVDRAYRNWYLDVIPIKGLRHAAGTGYPELSRHLCRPLRDQVREKPDVQIWIGRHVRQILLTDLAGTDDADTHPAGGPAAHRGKPRVVVA